MTAILEYSYGAQSTTVSVVYGPSLLWRTMILSAVWRWLVPHLGVIYVGVSPEMLVRLYNSTLQRSGTKSVLFNPQS